MVTHMKETPLNQAFEAATRKLASDPTQKYVARQLEDLQRMAVEFQEAGMPLTLAVRPGKDGAKREIEGDAFANGDIELGGLKLEFSIHKDSYYDGMNVEVYRGDEQVLERRATFDDDKKQWIDDEVEASDDDGGWDEDDDAGTKPAPEPQDLKSALTRYIVDVKTREDFVTRFSVGPEGVPGSAVEKPFPVAAPIRLRKPDAP